MSETHGGDGEAKRFAGVWVESYGGFPWGRGGLNYSLL